MSDQLQDKKLKVLCEITRAQHFAWRDAVRQICPGVDPREAVTRMWELTGQETARAYLKRIDPSQPLAEQVARCIVWSSQSMGEDAVVETPASTQRTAPREPARRESSRRTSLRGEWMQRESVQEESPQEECARGEPAAGESSQGEPARDEAFVRHLACPWLSWHERRDLLAEDRAGCDTWFRTVVETINGTLGTRLRVETLEAMPDGGQSCLRRLWVEE